MDPEALNHPSSPVLAGNGELSVALCAWEAWVASVNQH